MKYQDNIEKSNWFFSSSKIFEGFPAPGCWQACLNNFLNSATSLDSWDSFLHVCPVFNTYCPSFKCNTARHKSGLRRSFEHPNLSGILKKTHLRRNCFKNISKAENASKLNDKADGMAFWKIKIVVTSEKFIQLCQKTLWCRYKFSNQNFLDHKFQKLLFPSSMKVATF